MKPLPISVVINTKNSGETLERALKSVSWADEIVIMDMHSSDNTLDIATKFSAHIFSTKDVHYVEPARNEAISKASHDWILILDADEEIPKSLADKLKQLTTQDIDVWEIPRKNIIFDQWISHTGWWPDYQRRFFRKGHLKWTDQIHSIPKPKGISDQLPAEEKFAIIHYNYQTIEQFIDRLNRYTNVESKHQSSEKLSTGSLLNAGFSEFISRYYQQEGFKDQLHGLSLSLLQAFYQMVVKLKKWEQQGFQSTSVNIDKSLNKLIKEIKYWQAYSNLKKSHNPLVKAYWYLRLKLRV